MVECFLTGRRVSERLLGDQDAFCYDTPETGTVCFSSQGYNAAHGLPQDQKYILAGIYRNKKIKNEPAEMITTNIVNNILQQNIPYAFEAKARHFLKYLYDDGGKEFKSFDLNARLVSTIAYATPNEFERIVEFLKAEYWVEIRQEFHGAGTYHGLKLTKIGKEEVEKGLPKMPMFGLVSQEISTGDPTSDASIEQARKAFFDEPTNFESKRSACEALAFVLEPLRKELDGMFEGDTEIFFNIVNNFSIRHNKLSTRRINNEEQLEWVFYSLLNTINTFVKMKRKVQ
ncbi:hypothetical protein [Puia dinghuensis]|uniref:Uncharacterized protein n=1 Tax=Puia dinghuensis TaxID=1792502 RepID=A0A8J2XRS1_9BACT|nr:hypothetical protein [Puia dinghuensis]GGA90155.1 hypothetical protein GCM10011511_11750 [Puia dinghuensis]